jgi:Protein of unknown function (DUF1488)
MGEAGEGEMEERMPLKRAKPDIIVTTEGVEFLMSDESTEVPCRAECELLREKFGSSGADGDERAFRLNRETIEEAASNKYDAGKIEANAPSKVIVSAFDMASPLSRKM